MIQQMVGHCGGRGGEVRAKEAGKRATHLPAEVPLIHRDHSL